MLCLWLAVTGACIGSFINVVIYRLPKGVFMEEARSYCPACGKHLSWRELIPILSYVRLRGRCRFCKAPISMRYPIIEGACSALALLCFFRFGFNLQLLVSFCVIVVLLSIAVIDFDTMEIPDSLNIALIPLAVLSIWVFGDIDLLSRIIGFFIISLPMLLLALLINGAFGGGDIKLMAICGFLLGWKNVLLAFFVALLLGGSHAIWLLKTGRASKGEHMAFGPHLCFGIAVALLWGTDIVNFYLSLLYW